MQEFGSKLLELKLSLAAPSFGASDLSEFTTRGSMYRIVNAAIFSR